MDALAWHGTGSKIEALVVRRVRWGAMVATKQLPGQQGLGSWARKSEVEFEKPSASTSSASVKQGPKASGQLSLTSMLSLKKPVAEAEADSALEQLAWQAAFGAHQDEALKQGDDCGAQGEEEDVMEDGDHGDEEAEEEQCEGQGDDDDCGAEEEQGEGQCEGQPEDDPKQGKKLRKKVKKGPKKHRKKVKKNPKQGKKGKKGPKSTIVQNKILKKKSWLSQGCRLMARKESSMPYRLLRQVSRFAASARYLWTP